MDKENISRDEIAEAMKNEFGFNRKLCLDIVNDIIDIIIDIFAVFISCLGGVFL